MIQLQSLRGCLAVIAYRKWDFKILVLGMKSFNLGRRIVATYVQYPKEQENGNGVWRTFEHVDNLEKRDENRGKLVRNSPTQECGGKCTALDKSVLFWTQKGFEYEYGACFRDKT